MNVFKFGGASVKNASSVRNVAEVMKKFQGEPVVVVVSAMGKMTNALEGLVDAYCSRSKEAARLFSEIKDFHYRIMEDLLPDKTHQVHASVNNHFVEVDWVLEEDPARAYDFIYDQVVAAGEMVSSSIVSSFLNDSGIKNQWQDVRNFIRTDDTYREGKVLWQQTASLIKEQLSPLVKEKNAVVVTQGFIGGTSENYTTTLGREGSDYTAAILAWGLDAKEVVVWKDVPGVMNADPKLFEDAVKLEQISCQEAVEMTYYGATVIHPKTIRPLQNKGIPLRVKSFLSPERPGTLIIADAQMQPLLPCFIVKENQVLFSLSARDLSFVAEENLSNIFAVFARHRVCMNLMQHSAISFSVCVDNDKRKLPLLIEELQKEYRVLYNEQVELITIRHHDQPSIDRVTKDKTILTEQRSRVTVQLVIKS